MTSLIEPNVGKASPVKRVLSLASPPRDQFVTTGQLHSMPLTRSPKICQLEHYLDELAKGRAQGPAIQRRL